MINEGYETIGRGRDILEKMDRAQKLTRWRKFKAWCREKWTNLLRKFR